LTTTGGRPLAVLELDAPRLPQDAEGDQLWAIRVVRLAQRPGSPPGAARRSRVPRSAAYGRPALSWWQRRKPPDHGWIFVP